MRYSSRAGPAGAWTLPLTYTLIPGLTITRYWDNGPLLIAWTAATTNAAATLQQHAVRVYLDGSQVPQAYSRATCINGDSISQSGATIVDPGIGTHTIELRALGPGDATNTAQANGSRLTAIQLPHWDNTGDLL